MSEKSQLPALLNRIGQNFTANWYKIRDIQNWMMAEIERKRIQYPVWKKKVLFSWVSFNQSPRKRIKTVARFYSKKLDELFRYFFRTMFPFDVRRLDFLGVLGEYKNEGDTFFDYVYHLSNEEIQEIKDFQIRFNHPDHYQRIISYLFNLIVMVFGKLVIEILKREEQIIMLCANVQILSNQDSTIHFVIAARKADKNFLRLYLQTTIFNFAEKLPKLVSPKLLEQLRNKKDRIYRLARTEFPQARTYLNGLFFTLEKKCQVMQECTCILDILNFICSRLEDSIFETSQIVKDIIHQKISHDPVIIDAWFELFKFINTNASLFSTFQSNNRANLDNQMQLFFFYTQFLCNGMDSDVISPNYFFPEIVMNEIAQEKRKYPNFNQYFMLLFTFTLQGMSQLGNPAIDVAFKKIFKKPVFEVNEHFFESYLFSLNKKLHLLLQEYQQKLPHEDFSFNALTHKLTLILYNIVNRVFLAPTPEQAMQNFHDQLGRYTPERLALRVLELRIFKDIPLSDNNWQDYYLSRNKHKVKQIFASHFEIPDNFFFSEERLLKINMIYDRTSLETTPLLERWIISNIISAYFSFIDEIQVAIRTSKTHRTTFEILKDYLTQGILEQSTQEHLEEIAQFLESIWI